MRRRGCSLGAWATALAFAGLFAGGVGCSDPSGEIVLVVTTDLSIPKDIDRLKLTVRAEDRLFLDVEYPSLWEELKLPGTLGILGEPGESISIFAEGSKDGAVRIVRQVQIEVPAVREAMLRVPLGWLCDGSVMTAAYGQSSCPAGQTCVAGRCASVGVDASALPVFSGAEVFGGGSGAGVDGACFDTTACFAEAADAMPQGGELGCSIEMPAGAPRVNIALRTEADGICGPKGCFVPLDQGEPEGWVAVGSRIKLPSALCDHPIPGKVLGIVTSTQCAPKTPRTPACGTWSLAGKADPPNPSTPITLADGQMRPSGIAVAGESVYWLNSGSDEPAEGTVKKAPISGGLPVVLASAQASPSGLVADPSDVAQPFIYWLNEGSGAVMKVRTDGEGEPTLLTTWQGARSRLAVYESDLYFGVLGGYVLRVSTTTTGMPEIVAQDQGDPMGVTADGTGIYWADRAHGTVMRRPGEGGSPEMLALNQKSPIAIFAEAPSIYWINAGTGPKYDDGSVMKGSVKGGGASVLAKDQKMPYAIAADSDNIYWANKGDGTITKVSKAGGGFAVLASGQSNPIAIDVDDTSVYWANAGTASKKFGDGSIMKVAKKK